MKYLAYNVFMKKVTLGDMHRELKGLGMSISKNTLNNWLHKGMKMLAPLIEQLKESAIEKDSIVNCDETWCKVRRFNKYTKKYVWVLVNKAEGIVIFFYDNGSRGRKVLTDFLGNAEVRAIMADGYNAYHFLDGALKTDRLICLAHARAKMMKACNLGGDAGAKRFIELIDRLHYLEKRHRGACLSAEEILRQRQGREVEEIVARLRKLLERELKREDPHRRPYMDEALRYLEHFWDGLFLYRKNGSYPIDNNLAERQVRPLAVKRKTMLHYGSGEGARMASTYRSIISTVLMKGKSVWKFFGDFFTDTVSGGNMHLAYLQLAM